MTIQNEFVQLNHDLPGDGPFNGQRRQGEVERKQELPFVLVAAAEIRSESPKEPIGFQPYGGRAGAAPYSWQRPLRRRWGSRRKRRGFFLHNQLAHERRVSLVSWKAACENGGAT